MKDHLGVRADTEGCSLRPSLRLSRLPNMRRLLLPQPAHSLTLVINIKWTFQNSKRQELVKRPCGPVTCAKPCLGVTHCCPQLPIARVQAIQKSTWETKDVVPSSQSERAPQFMYNLPHCPSISASTYGILFTLYNNIYWLQLVLTDMVSSLRAETVYNSIAYPSVRRYSVYMYNGGINVYSILNKHCLSADTVSMARYTELK